MLEAFAYVKDLRDKWLRGVAWHDRHAEAEHPAWDDNWEKTAQRAREFGAAADDLAEYLECSVGELAEVLEYAETQK